MWDLNVFNKILIVFCLHDFRLLPWSRRVQFSFTLYLASYSKTNKIHLLSQIIYSCKTLYMFRTVFPSIIRSSRLHIQQQAYVKQLLLPAASSLELLMMDGKTVWNMQCVLREKIIGETGASCWFYYRNILRCADLWTSDLFGLLYVEVQMSLILYFNRKLHCMKLGCEYH